MITIRSSRAPRASRAKWTSADSAKPLAIILSLAIMTSVSVTSCAPERPMPVPSPTETVTSTADGVVRIGTLLSGSNPQVAGVELAIRDINRAGGVAGMPVEVFHRTSGAEDTDQLEVSFAQLVDRGVDVVIGPSSETLKARLAPLAAEAGVLLVAQAVATGEQDSDPLFVSLAAPLSAQAPAIAAGVVEVGATRVTLIAVSDSTVESESRVRFAAESQEFSERLSTELDVAGSRLALSTAFDVANPDLPRLLAAVTKSRAEKIVIAAPNGSTAAVAVVVEQLFSAGFSSDLLWLTSGVTASFGDLLAAGALEGAHGLRPAAESDAEFVRQISQSDPGVRSQLNVGESYDAVIMVALAAIVGADDGGASIARNVRAPVEGAIRCGSFAECIDVWDQGHVINYQGVSGVVDVEQDGSVRDAAFAPYLFGAENVPVVVPVP
ncbi:MAG: ABC transporter substrate-binding protein [Microbacteriaceae bacterium]